MPELVAKEPVVMSGSRLEGPTIAMHASGMANENSMTHGRKIALKLVCFDIFPNDRC